MIVSPFFSPSCIYNVSCSNFMLKTIQSHGSILGLFWGVQRILTCNNYTVYKESLNE